MGMFDNATDEHVRGEHVDGDTSGVCPVCRRESELADLYAIVDAPDSEPCPCCPAGYLPCPCHDTMPL